MTAKEILTKAYSRMTDLYGNKDTRYWNHSPSVQIQNRFYYEKQFLESNELFLRYLELVGRMRAVARERGEHLVVKGAAATSFIGYLLGATDINPLKLHEYCPQCKFVSFTKEQISPFDKTHKKCNCGGEIVVDGHDIFFDSRSRSLSHEEIEVSVSKGFINKAREMIWEEFSDKTIITLKNEEEISPIRLCFLDKEVGENAEYPFNRSGEFLRQPEFLLAPAPYLDKFCKLEKTTGIKMEDAHSEDMMNVMLSFLNGDTNGIPEFECDYIKKLIEKTSPTDYNELLNRMTFAEIPAFWEDVYNEIAKRLVGNGIYEDGFAYEVAKKAKLGSYALNGEIDNITVSGLLSLGFNLDFIFFIEKVRYMFPKHHAIVCLKYAIAFMWYKIHFKSEFEKIMKGESNDKN
jgi:hypothetical protein